jgi:hypothetical protein
MATPEMIQKDGPRAATTRDAPVAAPFRTSGARVPARAEKVQITPAMSAALVETRARARL